MYIHFMWFHNAGPKPALSDLRAGHFLERKQEGNLVYNADHSTPSDLTALTELSRQLDIKTGDVLQLVTNNTSEPRAYAKRIIGWIELLAPVTQGPYIEVFNTNPKVIAA